MSLASLRRFDVLIYVVSILAVQSSMAVLVKNDLIRSGFFEWSFLCKPGLALAYAWLFDGRKGLTGMLKPLLSWRLHPGWYAVAMCCLPLVVVSSAYASQLVSGTFGEPMVYDFWAVKSFQPKMYTVILLLSLSDELAFFGFVYMRLARRFTGVLAALASGACWSLSYLPRLTLDSGMMADSSMPFWLLSANLLAQAPICAWIYGSTKSALLVIFLQVAGNLWTLSVPVLPETTGSLTTYTIHAALTGLVSLLLVLRYGGRHLTVSGEPPPGLRTTL